MKNLTDLPKDIYQLFDPAVDHVPSEENLDAFCENMKQLFRTRLAKQAERNDRVIRFSSLGKPNRQMWFEAHPVDGGKEAMPAKTYVKFMYGDIIEQMLLFLTKEAGHSVEYEQGGVEVDGITGSIDAIIDGTVVDVKSASPFGYKKFEQGTVTSDDPFGYVAQLSGYATVLTPKKPAAWLANDKVGGDICVSMLPVPVIRHHGPADRIAELKKVIALEEPPELCYEPVPDGKSGNEKLPTPCSYCAHKFRCHPGLRTFLYSSGPRFLTKVSKLPDVYEVKGNVDVTDDG